MFSERLIDDVEKIKERSPKNFFKYPARNKKDGSLPLYGTGKLGDIEISDGIVENFNSYVRINKIDELDAAKVSFESDNAIIGAYEKFDAGEEILIHVSAAPVETEYLGKYIVAKILLNPYRRKTLRRRLTS